MKKCYTLFVIFIHFSSMQVSRAQGWESYIQFPGSPRDDASTFTIGDKVYCGLGRDYGFNCTRDFFIFDKSIDAWESGISMPFGAERQYAFGFAWNGKGYIFGGASCDGTFLNDLWEFNPASGSWVQLTGMPSNGRGGTEGFLIQNSIYIIGGRNEQGILREVWEYDLEAGIWTQKNDLPNDGIWRGASFEHGGFGYIGLGVNNLLSQTAHNASFYKYTPSADSWETVSNPGFSLRSYVGTVQYGDVVLFFGGRDENGNLLDSFDRLNITDWTIQPLPSFPAEKRKGGVCFLDGTIFYYTTGVSLTERKNETWRCFNTLTVPAPIDIVPTIYPNPASDMLEVSFNYPVSGELSIVSQDGKQINCVVTCNELEHIQLDVSSYEAGTYLLKVNNISKRFSVIR